MAFIEWLHRGRLTREQAGGKGAALSELMSGGFLVPGGFCVTADGYRHFAEAFGVSLRAESMPAAAEGARTFAEQVRALVTTSALTEELREQISEAYDELVAVMGGPACAVRSSAISEDGSAASFAGLYETYLNVRGVTNVLESVGRCYASLWSERALRYRSSREAGSPEEAMAVVVMGMVESETSGIAFTAHPVTGDRDQVVINASWGLGEAVVSGMVTPDSFVVHKQSGQILERDIYSKDLEIQFNPDGGGTVERRLPRERATAPSLSDAQVCEVARIATEVERHYGSPQDIEWGMNGGRIFVLQARPRNHDFMSLKGRQRHSLSPPAP